MATAVSPKRPAARSQRLSSWFLRTLPSGLRTRTASLSLMVGVALLLRLILVAFVYRDTAAPTVDHEAFGWEMGWVARSLALGHGFGSPFLPLTGATALVPPLYPYLLAVVFHFFGLYSAHSAFVILALNSLFSALTCIPIYLSVQESVGERTARLAGWAWVLFPYSIYFSAGRVWDYALTALLFSCCFCAAQRIHRHSTLSTWFGLGVLFGITVLSNPSVLTILPFLLLYAVFRVREGRRRRLFAAILTVLSWIAVVTPWAMRNERVLHAFSPVRDGFWIEAYAGNNGDTYKPNAAWAHPASNPVEMQKFEVLGETGYIAEKKVLTEHWIESHPVFFAELTIRRAVRFWTGFWSLNRRYLHDEFFDVPDIFFSTTLTILMLLGLRRIYQFDRNTALLYTALLLFFPLPYYLTHSSPDYREPIEPTILSLVTFGIFGLRDWKADSNNGQLSDESDPEASSGHTPDLAIAKATL